MTHRRLVLPLAVCITYAALAVLASRAGAQGTVDPWDPRFTTLDPVIVGNSTGTLIGGVPPGFDVTMRDVYNVPKANSVVTLDFSATTVKLYSAQNPGTTVNCVARTLSRNTDAQGRASFGARFGGFTNSLLVEVIGDGVPIGGVKARSTDIDGIDGQTGLGDLALFSANLLGNPTAQETDFDLSGSTGLGDLSLLSGELLGRASSAYCP